MFQFSRVRIWKDVSIDYEKLSKLDLNSGYPLIFNYPEKICLINAKQLKIIGFNGKNKLTLKINGVKNIEKKENGIVHCSLE